LFCSVIALWLSFGGLRQTPQKKRKRLPVSSWILLILLAEISLKQTCECLAVSCFVTKTLENVVKTGIFNRLAQNQHKSTKIYTVDFSS